MGKLEPRSIRLYPVCSYIHGGFAAQPLMMDVAARVYTEVWELISVESNLWTWTPGRTSSYRVYYAGGMQGQTSELFWHRPK